MIDLVQLVQEHMQHHMDGVTPPVIVVWTPDDWVKIITAIFSGLGAFIAGIGAVISATNARRGKRVENAALSTSQKVDKIDENTNGMSAELQAKLQNIAHAEGYQKALIDHGIDKTRV